jgi:hypothetical protein
MNPIEKSSSPETENTALVPFPLRVLREAIRAVPQVRWALAVVGVVAAIAIIQLLNVRFVVAAIGTVIMLILMMALVIFAYAARVEAHAPAVGKTFVWFAMTMIMATTIAVFGSATLNQPWHLKDWIVREIKIKPLLKAQQLPYKHTFKFADSPLPFDVSRDDSREPEERYTYGYTNLAFDKEQPGRYLSVKRIGITLHITNKKDWLCCDVWVFLGGSQFKSQSSGFRGVTRDPNQLWSAMGPIPVRLKLVLTQSDQKFFPRGQTDLYAEYDFPQPIAQGTLATMVKDSSSMPFSLENGLDAQVVVWTGFSIPNRPTEFEVDRVELTVEGFTEPSQ